MGDLTREARYLHAALFGAEPPEGLAEAYARFVTDHDVPDGALTDRIVDAGLDVEAIEFYLRLRGRSRGLTVRLRAVVYLAECLAPTHPWFAPGGTGPREAVADLARAGIRAAAALVRGAALTGRHHLV